MRIQSYRITLVALSMFVLSQVASASEKNKIETGTIVGFVVDKDSGTAIPGANVSILGTSTGGVSDIEGRFEIRGVQPGTYSLAVSMLGYARTQIDAIVVVDQQETSIGRIELVAESVRLNEIVVTPGRFSIMGSAELSRQVLSSEDIKNMSWAEDITRVVARLPGISSSDYSSKFTIRGGESDEVLMTLDGMELYEPFHQRDYSGGLFSIVDIETVDGIELMTGGYSSEYGNRLSGVFNMRTKRIQPGQRHTSIGLSILNARFYTDGSFKKGKGSYMLSARRGMLDVLFGAWEAAEEATIDQGSSPKFYDAMAKIEYDVSDKHRLSIHGLRAGDRNSVLDEEGINFDKNDTKYGNTYGWLTLNSTHSPTLFSRSILYSGLVTHDRTGSFNKYEPSDKGFFNLSDKRDYSFFGLKQDWNWQAANNLFVTGGFEAKQLKATYDYFSELEEIRVDTNRVPFDYANLTEINVSPSGQQIGLYATGRFKILPKLVAETGVRYDKSTYTNDDLISPRIGLAYAISDRTVIRGAWGYYYQSQFINDLDVNHGSTTFNTAELAKHYVVGVEHKMKNGLELRAEGYLKDLSNYSPAWQNLRDHLEIFPEARNDNARVVRSGAESKGLELFAKYDTGGKFSWWLSYALAGAEDIVTDIQYDGRLTKVLGNVPRLNNQRHTVYGDVNYRPAKKWHLNLSWTYYQGWPRTDYTYEYITLDNDDLHFYAVHGEFNSTEYPAFHRMDLRTNRSFDIKRGKINTYLHLINLYNHENLKKFDLDTRDDDGNFSLDSDGNYVQFRDDKNWFGFVPVLGVSWEF